MNTKYKIKWQGKELTKRELLRFEKYAKLNDITLEEALKRDELPPCDYEKNPCFNDWCKCTN